MEEQLAEANANMQLFRGFVKNLAGITAKYAAILAEPAVFPKK